MSVLPDQGRDPDADFGLFLVGRGVLTQDQMREGYRLLLDYRQKLPKVNLAQVLARHDMASKDALRQAYQEFLAQGTGGAALPPTPPPPPTPSGSHPVPSGSRHGSQFVKPPSFKTVELDPDERPDSGSFGSRAGSAFPRGIPPTIDPEGGPQSGVASGFPFGGDAADREATLFDRRGPGGTQRQASGPGGTQRQRGPRGTHAGPPSAPGGPGGTHAQGSSSRSGGKNLLAAIPKVVGTPLDDMSDSGDLFIDSEEGEDGHEDTNVQSSTFGSFGSGRGKRPRAAAAARSRKGGPPLLGLVIAGAAVVAVLGLVAAFYFRAQARAEAKARFLEAVASKPAAEALAVGQDLDEALREEDAEVRDAIAGLEQQVAAEERRAKAEAALAQLEGVADLDGRLAVCDEALDIDDTFSRAYVERARLKYVQDKRGVLQAKGRPGRDVIERAMGDLRLAMKEDKTSPWPYYVRADLLLDTGNDPDTRGQAKQDLDRVGAMAPDTALALLALGRRVALDRKFAKAIEAFDQAIDKDPRLLDAYLARADARMQQSNYAGALRDANQAVDLDRRSSAALTLRAQARFHANNDRQGALIDLEEALRLDPTRGGALALRAYARLERDMIGFVASPEGDVKASIDDARQALHLDPALAMAHLALAEIFLKERKTSEAITHAGKAVEYSHRFPQAYLVRARLRVVDGDFDHAFLDVEQVLQLEPDNARALTIKASLLVQRRDFDQARMLLERGLEIDRDLPQAYWVRGYLNLQSRPRNYPKAIEDFSEALGLEPAYADAYFYRAVCYYDRRNFQDALSDLAKAEELRESEAKRALARFPLMNLYLTRGHAHYKLENWQEAIEAYEAFLKVAPVGSVAIQKVRTRKQECEAKLAGDGEGGGDGG
jgi:tetratricopeptide (TPR) repeat protein